MRHNTPHVSIMLSKSIAYVEFFFMRPHRAWSCDDEQARTGEETVNPGAGATWFYVIVGELSSRLGDFGFQIPELPDGVSHRTNKNPFSSRQI